jgi:transcription elongation factor GreA
MSEELIKNVQNMLNEEKFTRAMLGNYSIDKFKSMDAVLKEAAGEPVGPDFANPLEELKRNCDEHLQHTKNSIIALYISGMIALSRQHIDDSALVNLVTIFVDNHKWNIVKYLCDRILDYGESKFALRMLGECYKNDNEEEALYGVWQRLVKIDYEEADITKTLADRFEKQGDLDQAIDYFRKALHRYINKGVFTNVREIWAKLLEYQSEDIDFLLNIQKKVAKNISEEKAILLLEDVCALCKKKNDVNTAITILKIILDYDEKDNNARKELTECFKDKYAEHSQLEEYLRISNLSQNWRNVHEAIQDFEKHIAFDKGNFVFHRTWGVGRIAKISGDEIVIDFAKQRAHSMSLKMAVTALQTLTKDHIWVLKATWKKEKLHDKIKEEPAWALKNVIKSFGNACDMKHIKAELVPSVLSAGEWTSWSSKAKDILKSDPLFGVSPANIDIFTVRERPISIDEKLYNEFKAEKKFFNRVAIIRSFMDRDDFEIDSEYFAEMFAYFGSYLKSYNQANEQIVASYLLVKEIAGGFPSLTQGLELNFLSLFEKIEDVTGLFVSLKDAELKRDFLKQIKIFCPQWADIYIKLFPRAQLSIILENLLENGYEDKLISMTAVCFDNYRDRESRDTAVWLYEEYSEKDWFKKTLLSPEKILITLIYILDTTYREIENRRDTPENRKTNKKVYKLLFEKNMLDAYIDQADRETIIRICTLIEDVKDLDPSDKLKLRNRILDKYPDFKFLGGVEKEQVTRGLIVTAGKYGEKQRQLAHIMEEEVPANSKEIAFALSLGDLRENAEYKAAKEKQELLNSTVAKLRDEIERAQLFDPRSVNTNRVSFGTVVTLLNTTAGKTEQYTILGPWESDPNRKVISYLSPFGAAIMNKKVSDSFEFAAGEGKASYSITDITSAEI